MAQAVLVGDALPQLASIGPGGLFDRVSEHAPSARLTEVYRAREDWEREAWRAFATVRRRARGGVPGARAAHGTTRARTRSSGW